MFALYSLKVTGLNGQMNTEATHFICFMFSFLICKIIIAVTFVNFTPFSTVFQLCRRVVS